MPELPEVETVRAGLAEILRERPSIKAVRLMRADIRFKIPRDLPSRLEGAPITGVRRRAKYLLIDTPKVSLLSHLGMTGSWRVLEKDAARDPHDHCYIDLDDGRTLAYRDPRRFGIIDLLEPGGEENHPRLRGLGVEPLDVARFTGEFFFQSTRKRKLAAKVFLMDQRIVVGIGNIYASEVLFRAGVRPGRAAGRLSRVECGRIVQFAREVLVEAIESGGSSIRDYRQAGGEEGGFQALHLVYGRAKEPCRRCGAPISSLVLGGRSTFWCAKCQR